jgi:hypothetical protein
MMIWSSEKELKSTIQRVRDHSNSLKANQNQQDIVPSMVCLPPVALGAERDKEEHRQDSINVEPCGRKETVFCGTHEGNIPIQHADTSDSVFTAPEVTSDEERGEGVLVDDTDDEIEVVGVRIANSRSY